MNNFLPLIFSLFILFVILYVSILLAVRVLHTRRSLKNSHPASDIERNSNPPKKSKRKITNPFINEKVTNFIIHKIDKKITLENKDFNTNSLTIFYQKGNDI